MLQSDHLPESTTICFTPIEEDYVAAMRIFFWQKKQTWIIIAMWAVVTLILIRNVMVGVYSDNPLLGIIFLLSSIMIIIVFLTAPLRVGKQIRKKAILTNEVTWDLDDKWVIIRTSEIETKLAWSNISKVKEISTHYLFVSSASADIYSFVPKRAFLDHQQEIAFRNLLKQHVRKYE